MKISEKDLAATVIRTEIERLAEAERRRQEKHALTVNELEEEGLERDRELPGVQDTFRRVVYGSRMPESSIEALERLQQNDMAFRNFRSKLGSAVTPLLNLPTRVTLPASHLVMWQFYYEHNPQLTASRSHHFNLSKSSMRQ